MKKPTITQKIVLDSCIFAKIFLDEKGHEPAKKLIRHLVVNETKILVPSLFSYEIYSIALRNKVPFNVISQLLKQYKQFNLEEVELENNMITKSEEIISSGNNKSGYPSIYDAIYHSLAILNNCDFITDDRKYYEKVRRLGNIKLLENLN